MGGRRFKDREGKGKPSMSTVPVYNSTDKCFAHRKTLIDIWYLLKTVIIYRLIVYDKYLLTLEKEKETNN